MQSLNLGKYASIIRAVKRPKGMTGYLYDLSSQFVLWTRSIRRHPLLLAWSVFGLVVTAILVANTISSRPAAVVQPAITMIVATPTAALQLVSDRPSGPTLQQAAIAYDAPGGNPMDALAPGLAYTVVARSGMDWTQIQLADGARIWVRSSKLPGYAPDIATAVPTAEPPAPVRELVYVNDAPAAAPAAPEVAQAAPEPTAVVIVDPVRASPCAGREIEERDGLTWQCVVTSAGDVAWFLVERK